MSDNSVEKENLQPLLCNLLESNCWSRSASASSFIELLATRGRCLLYGLVPGEDSLLRELLPDTRERLREDE